MIKTFIDDWSDAQYEALLDKELIIGGGVKSFIGSFEITYIPPSLKDLENMKKGIIESFDRLWKRLHNIDEEFLSQFDEDGNKVIE